MHTQSSSGSFNQTLQFITTIKLQELEKQRQAYQSQAKVLSESAALGDDSIARLELLHKAISAWAGPGAIKNDAAIGSKLILKNLSHWLDQAKDDPTFAPGRLNKWVDTLETFIRHSSLRFDCAKLFGTLFNEWLSSGDSSTTDNIALDKPDTPAVMARMQATI
ncbi:hypothetical protein BD779DRAFT_243141 [Infundibulicybe gibba]|nr:hypothetical protein BD779DRAFT_243141 [Infundibulicybe gibba]